MNTPFADRLMAAVRDKGTPACVGLDPLIERLPENLRKKHAIDTASTDACGADARSRIASAFVEFGRGVIRAVAPHIPAIKINIAFFERYHTEGIRAYHELVQASHEAGLIVIGDVKRADIGHTSMQYAIAQLGGEGIPPSAVADAITINPYFGSDGVAPFIEVAHAQNRGLFVLVQTSNPSASEVQGLTLPDGLTVCQHVAKLVQTWAAGEGLIGDSGYSCVGAVVSPRDLESTVRIRELMPNCIFLVPGFGAQGRTAGEVAKCFKEDGTGALVTASRSVIYAFSNPKYGDAHGDDWRACVEAACKDLVVALRDAVGITGAKTSH